MNTTPTKNTPRDPKGPQDLFQAIFKAAPRSIIANANNPSTPPARTVDVADNHAEGALFDVGIMGALAQLQQQITTLQQQTAQQRIVTQQIQQQMAQQRQQITALQAEMAQLRCPICFERRKNARVFCGQVFANNL